MVQVKKFDWMLLITTIVPIVLGGSVVTTMITTLMADMNKPDVQVDILPKSDPRNVTMKIYNLGRSPATNLKVSVNTPENIGSYHAFTTDNINLTKIGPTRLFLNASKLVQGDGSLILLDLQLNATPQKDYSVYAVFNEGSSKGKLPSSEIEGFYNFIVESLYHHPVYSIIVIIIIIPLAVIIFRRFLRWRRNKYAVHFTLNMFSEIEQELYKSGLSPQETKQETKDALVQLQLYSTYMEEERDRGIITDQTYGKIKKMIDDKIENFRSRMISR